MTREGDRSWTTAGIDPKAYVALVRDLPASRLWTLLLDVLSARASDREPVDLLRQWERDGFTRPAATDQRAFLHLDGHLFAAASAFEAIELSPVAPLGTSSAVAPVGQNKIVSALRGTEVVADPTSVLALECAARLRRNRAKVVRLATSHRCVRAQPVPRGAGFATHFRIFCLAAAGIEREDHGLQVDALAEQIGVHLDAFRRLERDGYAFPERTVVLLARAEGAAVAQRVAAKIHGAPVVHEVLDRPYYSGGVRFMIHAGPPDGSGFPLVDGGAFDWVGKLASNRRLVFVASAFGSQLAAARYRTGSEVRV